MRSCVDKIVSYVIVVFFSFFLTFYFLWVMISIHFGNVLNIKVVMYTFATMYFQSCMYLPNYDLCVFTTIKINILKCE